MSLWLRRLRLRRRVFILFAAYFLLIAVDFGAAVVVMVKRDREQSIVQRHLSPARDEVSALSTGFVDQESGERGYLITGMEPFLGPYNQGGSAVDSSVTTLRGNLARFPQLRAALESAADGIAQWRAQAATPEIAARRAGRADEAVALVSSGRGAQLFRQANNRIRLLREGVVAELTRREGDLERARRNLTTVLLFSFGIGALLLALGAVLFERWVHRPIDHLSAAVRAVAGGDLELTIPSPGPPDLAELGDDVESMRARLLREMDDAGRAREALARRGLVVLALRDELARGTEQLPEPLVTASRFEPAEGVLAGDWWDIVRLEDDRAALAVVDVSGHGAASGVFALRAKQLVMASLRSGWAPGEALSWVARSLGDTGEQFLTGVVVEVRATDGRWRYANAGHPPILLRSLGGIEELPPTGPILGPLPGEWETREVTVPPAAFLAVYTDGLIEARNAEHEEFGIERLVQALETAEDRGLDSVADHCLSSLRRFTGRRADDDVTLVLLGRT